MVWYGMVWSARTLVSALEYYGGNSGLVYLLSEWVMATMILACWSNRDVSWFIKVWKFVELTADNMLAATNFAICLQLSLIVSVSTRTNDVPRPP